MKSFVVLALALLATSPAYPASAPAGGKTSTTKKAPAKTAAAPAPAAVVGADGVVRQRGKGPFLPKAIQFALDTVKYLPDTTLMAKVETRAIDADRLRTSFYGADFTARSHADSAGRLEFLNSMINKEVLGLTARSINVPLDFTDRANLRGYSDVVLQNALYQYRVADSIIVTEAELQGLIPQFSREVLIREIPFDDEATAERVRLDLLRGRTTWADAQSRYADLATIRPDTLEGWKQRADLSGELGLRVFNLKPGGISEVVQDLYGYHLIQVLKDRPSDPLPAVSMRRILIRDLRGTRSAPLVKRMYGEAQARAGAVYDSTNIRWLANHFRTYARLQTNNTSAINLSSYVPTAAPEDTGRILLRTKTRAVSVNQFVHEYKNIPPMQRHRLVSVEPVIFTLNGIFLAPELITLAQEQGLDKDPTVVDLMEERREKLMVEHMYSDSVMHYVSVTSAERHKYFDDHRDDYKVPTKVRFGYALRYNQVGVDSVIDVLERGGDLRAIVRDDSLKGYTNSAMREMSEGQNYQYAKILFEELRPGQYTKIGPDFEGKYLVLGKIDQEPERRQTYDEAEQLVDDAVQADKADVVFKAFLNRRRTKYKIVMRPELIMKINFTDPLVE
jgi:hypothetical protein